MAKRGSKGGLRRFVAASAAAVAMVMFAPTAADAAAAVSKIGAAVEPHTFDAQAKEHDGYIWRPKKHSNRGFFFVEKGAHQKSQNVVENNMVLPSEGDKAVSEDAVRDTSEPESSAEEDTGDEEQAAQSNSLDKKHKMKAPRDEDENSDDSQTGAFVQNKGKFFFATRDGKEASQKDQGSFIQNHGKFFFATKDGKEASQQDQGSFIQNHGKFFFATKDGKEASQQDQGSFMQNHGKFFFATRDGKEASQKHHGSFTSTKDGPSKKRKARQDQTSPGDEQDQTSQGDEQDRTSQKGEPSFSEQPSAPEDDTRRPAIQEAVDIEQNAVDQQEAQEGEGMPGADTMPGAETNDSETSSLEEGKIYRLRKDVGHEADSAMQLRGSQGSEKMLGLGAVSGGPCS